MSITEQQITSLADALRGELELGSDGSTFEATIRLWLDGDYDGPHIAIEGAAPKGETTHALDGLLAHVGLRGPVVIRRKSDGGHPMTAADATDAAYDLAVVLCRGVHPTRFAYRATATPCDSCLTGAETIQNHLAAQVVRTEWGVVLDDLGSTDTYEERSQAEAARYYMGGHSPLARIDTVIVDPGSDDDPIEEG